MREVFMASLSGEIVLKSSRTRPRFEERLVRNLKDALERNNVDYNDVWIEEARLYIDSSDEKTVEVGSRVFGIHWITRTYTLTFNTLEDLASKVSIIAKEWVKDKTFAIRARRAGRHNFTSIDIAKIIGSKLLAYSRGVDLEEPEVEVHVEVRSNRVYVYKTLTYGPDGLPIGVEGNAIVLFSGGIDSPVAAWFTAKRGVEVHFLHLVLANEKSAKDAEEVAKILTDKWLYGYTPVLIIADFRDVVAAIARHVAPEYRQVVLRAAMYKYAEEIAYRKGFEAIVTGESLGQVSTQTLKNLKALSEALHIKLPLLRPLIGFDKEEIVKFARRIGTYERSARTREYCRLGYEATTTRANSFILAREFGKIGDIIGNSRIIREIKLIER